MVAQHVAVYQQVAAGARPSRAAPVHHFGAGQRARNPGWAMIFQWRLPPPRISRDWCMTRR
jgi:hypothetical protein